MGKACSCKRNCRRSLEVTIYKKADTFRSVGFLSAINQSLRFELNLYDIRLRTRKIKIAPIEYIIINVKSTSFPKRLRLVANAFSASVAQKYAKNKPAKIQTNKYQNIVKNFREPLGDKHRKKRKRVAENMCAPGIRFSNV